MPIKAQVCVIFQIQQQLDMFVDLIKFSTEKNKIKRSAFPFVR